MKGAEIRTIITQNLRDAGWDADDVRVQPDPFSGWRIAVVSIGFEGRSPQERRAVVLAGLEELHVEWMDLLTPEEREWAGPLPLDTDLDDLPLWPEALARSGLAEDTKQPVVFASDLDADLPPPIVVTFYSLRGGVGRSTALAYTAQILASRGRKVVCVDMDLEAPGLAALFGREKDIGEGLGLVHALTALDRGEEPDLSTYLLRLSESNDLYCLPAGRPDANYARLLRYIDPGAWYREERNPLRQLVELLSKRLPFTPDVVLLDARTGMTALSGPLLFDLSDMAVIVFFPHPQTATGTAALVRALLAARTRRDFNNHMLTPEPRFLVSPVPASRAPEVVRRYEHRAIEWIADWLSVLEGRRQGQSVLVEAELTHFIPYREVIATSDTILSDPDMWRDYEPVAEWIERFLPAESEVRVPVTLATLKPRILEEMKFSAGTAEEQQSFQETFVETALMAKAISPDIPLVLGRKGTGKTAVFRRLLEDPPGKSIAVLAPGRLRGQRPWMLSADGFQAVEEMLQRTATDWRQFWTAYIATACFLSSPSSAAPPQELNAALGNLHREIPPGELDVVRLLENIFTVPGAALLLSDWIHRIDRQASHNTLVLFDGLDTGFGHNDKERERRRQAISGLFAFLIDRGDRFEHLRLKVVLREDIWRSLRFENKSHLFGRSVRLEWSDRPDFFKVVIKQAIQSPAFRDLLTATPGGSVFQDTEIGSWPESVVFHAWNVLVGERMKGEKTTFTRNWVWNRLADGSGDHSPRYLLQLFYEVAAWERKEQLKIPYERSVLRPRGLIAVLPTVSEQALSALRDEEFPELRPLLSRLTEIGRTPVNAEELESLSSLVALAREVGLLAVYEGSDERVERYKVPDMYRLALGMTRRGQA